MTDKDTSTNYQRCLVDGQAGAGVEARPGASAASVSDERLARFGKWLNGWGDLDKKPQRRSRDWREGYEEAIRNAYDLFENLYPSWPAGGTDGS